MKLYKSAKAGKEIMKTYDTLLSGWHVAATELDVTTRYGQTHVITAGRKELPPLVLFHGVGDDSALMWIYNAKSLSEHFCIYAVDTIGGPGKSRPDARYDKTFDDTLWIDDLLNALQLEKVCMAGVSHGGYLVQLYTLTRSERVENAIAISSSVPAGGKTGSPMKTMLKIFLPEALFPTKKNVEKLIRKLSGTNAAAFLNHPDIMEHQRRLLKGFNNRAMMYHKVRRFSDDEVNEIRGKLLYLVGEEDPFQKLGGKNALLSYNMNTIFYRNGGHGLNHELADEINDKIAEYLNRGGISQ